VKFFWPIREKAKGFSIENLSLKYREKTTNSSSSIEIQNQSIIDNTLRSENKVINLVESPLTYRNENHWANRDFSEYEDFA
tara:strand:+ start:670 stop:912 length:243 start_codon:yes stop_codon:yes gene_type:complete